MKQGFKIFGIIMAWLLLISGVVTLLVAATSQRKLLTNKAYNIAINTSDGVRFMDSSDVINQLNEIGLPQLTNQKIEQINLSKAEKHLERLPYVADAQLYIGRNGMLHIDIEQRKPILRVFNTDNLSFYVGEKNEIIPCSKKYTAHVPVLINAPAGLADYINKQDTAVFRLVCNMAKHIAGSEFWSAQVDEIIWNHDQTFDIIPNIGTHTIKLGDIKNYEKKLDKIALFYQKNMAKKIMWDKYETINAAYSNQIICKNKKNTNEPIDTTLTNH